MVLKCEEVFYSDLAQQFATPLYVYSLNNINQAYDAYVQAFDKLDPLFCYAVKANSNLSILKHFVELGSGFDIVSGGELARVLAVGGDAKKVIFSGVGKSHEEIKFALEANILCFNVESLPELDRINEVAASLGKIAPISLRINPDVDAKTHPYISTGLKDNKFGIAYADALSAFRKAKHLPNLEIVGIDCHIGSQLIDLSPLVEAAERLLALVDQLSLEGIELHHIDIGGGVGIVYDDEEIPNLKAYANAIAKLFAQRPQRLVLEPGRSLVGNAGTLLTKVEYVKEGETKKFVIVDAAMNDLIRPALYGAYQVIEVVESACKEAFVADVVGPVCESGDFLGKDRTLACEAGDLLVIKSAGAYSSAMSSNYNSRNRVAEVLVDGDNVKLIRHRDSYDEQIANEKSCLK